jgi:hypothetical protein
VPYTITAPPKSSRREGRHRHDLASLGQAKPSMTLAVYAHMFTTDDSKAAAAINAALRVS